MPAACQAAVRTPCGVRVRHPQPVGPDVATRVGGPGSAGLLYTSRAKRQVSLRAFQELFRPPVHISLVHFNQPVVEMNQFGMVRVTIVKKPSFVILEDKSQSGLTMQVSERISARCLRKNSSEQIPDAGGRSTILRLRAVTRTSTYGIASPRGRSTTVEPQQRHFHRSASARARSTTSQAAQGR